MDGRRGECETIARVKVPSLPEITPASVNSCTSISSTFQSRGITPAGARHAMAGIELILMSLVPLLSLLSQVSSVFPLLRCWPQTHSSACGLASSRTPATIPNVPEALFWMKKLVQFCPLFRQFVFLVSFHFFYLLFIFLHLFLPSSVSLIHA